MPTSRIHGNDDDADDGEFDMFKPDDMRRCVDLGGA